MCGTGRFISCWAFCVPKPRHVDAGEKDHGGAAGLLSNSEASLSAPAANIVDLLLLQGPDGRANRGVTRYKDVFWTIKVCGLAE
jgi:hypothetical protein